MAKDFPFACKTRLAFWTEKNGNLRKETSLSDLIEPWTDSRVKSLTNKGVIKCTLVYSILQLSDIKVDFLLMVVLVGMNNINIKAGYIYLSGNVVSHLKQSSCFRKVKTHFRLVLIGSTTMNHDPLNELLGPCCTPSYTADDVPQIITEKFISSICPPYEK